MALNEKLGNFGTATESYAAGVASASAAIALPATDFGLALSLQINGTLDATVLIGFLAAKIGGPIPAEVAQFLELALKST